MRPSVRRSPADVLRLAVAAVVLVVLLLLEALFGDTLVAFASDLLRGLDAVPQWIIDAIVIGTRLVVVVVIGGGVLWMVSRRRWRTLATTAAAGALAVVVYLVLDAVVQPDTGLDPLDVQGKLGLLSSDRPVSFAGVAAVAGVLTAVAPWVERRWRKAGWAVALGLMITTFVQSPVSFQAVLALAVGWLSGAAVLVVGGAPSRAAHRGGRHRRPRVPSGCRCSGSSRPASTPAARRRTSGSPPTARGCSSRRSAPTSAAPISSSGSTARSCRTTSVTSGRSTRCGGASSTRRSWR